MFRALHAAPIIIDMAQGLLGKLTPAAFLRRHWQKQPLYLRAALPDCAAWLDRGALFEWATRDELESRLVTHACGRWGVQHGPFTAAQLRHLPARGWTLLVQGVEQIHPAAAMLLQRFSFIPHARLDDLMVSFAPPGGGVGPHFDSYDVFLLQGAGTRRWRISAQKNLALVDDAPLRILKQFHPRQEWLCTRGDLLYLPPRYAHDGVALDDCITLSVGFRAPRHQQLTAGFLDFLQDELHLDGIYADPGLRVQRHPAQLPADLLRQFSAILTKIRWNEHDIRRFTGRYLTEPKSNIVFRPPRRPANLRAFVLRVSAKGVRLALPTRMLFCGNDVFINGEHHRYEGRDGVSIMRLADERSAPAFAASDATARLLHAWYCAGYIEI
jgi:50S ribosomal protein L16 3-hydroxylase